MSFETQKNEIIKICKKLFKEEGTKVIIGFAQSEVEGITTPLFMRTAEDAEKLKWDSQCTPNLAKYLLEKRGKVGIIAKTCDARAIVMYLVEHQIKRDELYIIGVECPGMKNNAATASCGCEACKMRIPPIYDVLVKYNAEITLPDSEEASNTVAIEDNLKKFQDEMKKCILCYSCRQVCYGCYCKSCFVDMNVPNWLPGEISEGAKMIFHLGRAMHLAGRCVECGACERVCPSGVKIRYLIKEITKFTKELYAYEAGLDPEETPALAVFNPNDSEAAMSGSEVH
jgi:formate dehydrogenase (coenzyme F420) beta subunit